jgi:hypothetical protein
VHSFGVSNWFQIYSVPSIEVNFNDESLGQVAIKDAGNSEISINDRQLSLNENKVIMTMDERTKGFFDSVSIQVKLDIRTRNPWWANNVPFIYAIATLDVFFLSSLSLSLVRLLRRMNSQC